LPAATATAPGGPGAPAVTSPPRAPNSRSRSSAGTRRSPRPALPLVEAAGSSDTESDCADGDYVPSSSDVSTDDDSFSADGTGADGPSWLHADLTDAVGAAMHRGGRMRKEDVEHELGRAGCDRRSFAAGFVRNARFAAGGRSMYQLYKEVTASFAYESSRRECLALSRILDALLRRDLVSALEHTCRRLGGVHTAAETGNWAMCERLETEAEQRSFVPEKYMRSALKSVTQMQAVKRSAVDVAPGAANNKGGSGPSGRRHGGKRKSTNKDSAGKESNGTGPASQKKRAFGSGSQ
jgi:hypothetical protein